MKFLLEKMTTNTGEEDGGALVIFLYFLFGIIRNPNLNHLQGPSELVKALYYSESLESELVWISDSSFDSYVPAKTLSEIGTLLSQFRTLFLPEIWTKILGD